MLDFWTHSVFFFVRCLHIALVWYFHVQGECVLVVEFKEKRSIASCYSLGAYNRSDSFHTVPQRVCWWLISAAVGEHTQSFAHWEVIGCSLALVCLCLLIVVTPLDSIGAVSDSVAFAYLLNTIRFRNYCRYSYWHYLLDCAKSNLSYFSTQLMDRNNRIQVHRAEKMKALMEKMLDGSWSFLVV